MRDGETPDVVIVGSGPVGLLLGAELRRHGVGARILEQRPQPSPGSRAIGIHSPVLAALEESDLTDGLLARARRVSRGEARSGAQLLGTVRFDGMRVRFPFVATLPQSATEAVLAAAAPPVEHGWRVHGVRPDGHRMRVRAEGPDGPAEISAPLVIVAAGAAGRDLVFHRAGLDTVSYPDRYLMADAPAPDDADDAAAIVRLERDGVLESFPLPGARRFVVWDPHPDDADPQARLDRLRRALARRGEPAAAERVTAATGFGVRRVVAPQLRRGRLLVVGDAAHEVSPIGGQGMNLGLLDAATLAPLVARWMRTGTAPDPELERWQRRRVASARRAAASAGINTRLGRPRGEVLHRARSAALRTLLTGPAHPLLARAYAMQFDLDA
ncbi:NAD(P)/FAD-dependent oxidoreductase [Microbacterium sp. NPDC089189]|uniref:FAD-dependent oxidoreductase n=1 Tax=Microbacterium sp. NPDC089189 TaxID=3154972 RepID=UPI0034212E60